MKKAVFAIQVFGLIAMIPAYLLAEFNHGTGKQPVINHSVEMTQQLLKSDVQPAAGHFHNNGYAIVQTRWYSAL